TLLADGGGRTAEQSADPGTNGHGSLLVDSRSSEPAYLCGEFVLQSPSPTTIRKRGRAGVTPGRFFCFFLRGHQTMTSDSADTPVNEPPAAELLPALYAELRRLRRR